MKVSFWKINYGDIMIILLGRSDEHKIRGQNWLIPVVFER